MLVKITKYIVLGSKTLHVGDEVDLNANELEMAAGSYEGKPTEAKLAEEKVKTSKDTELEQYVIQRDLKQKELDALDAKIKYRSEFLEHPIPNIDDINKASGINTTENSKPLTKAK